MTYLTKAKGRHIKNAMDEAAWRDEAAGGGVDGTVCSAWGVVGGRCVPLCRNGAAPFQRLSYARQYSFSLACRLVSVPALSRTAPGTYASSRRWAGDERHLQVQSQEPNVCWVMEWANPHHQVW